MSFQVKDAISSTTDGTGHALNTERLPDGGGYLFGVQHDDGRVMTASLTKAQAVALARWILRDEA